MTVLVVNRLLLCCYMLSTDRQTDGRVCQSHVRVEGSIPPNPPANQSPGFPVEFSLAGMFQECFRKMMEATEDMLKRLKSSWRMLEEVPGVLQEVSDRFEEEVTILQIAEVLQEVEHQEDSRGPERDSRVPWGGSSGP